jgi:hypothetical protein
MFVCNENGDRDFSGISPTNKGNSEILLQIVDKIKPDIVHIHFEGAFYGLVLHSKDTTKVEHILTHFIVNATLQ